MKKSDIYNYAMSIALQAIKRALHESTIQWNYNDATHVAHHIRQLDDLIHGNVKEDDFLYQNAKEAMEQSEKISKIRQKLGEI